MNPPECVWGILNHILTKDHIAGKGENSLQHYNIGSQIYSYASSYENSGSKKADKEWEKIGEEISAWNLTKVKSKKEVIDEARRRRALQFILHH